jgi:hypothetical protein
VAEFQWWLLLVGLVAGGGLVAIVFFDGSRRDADLADDERRAEASWISIWLRGRGRSMTADDVSAVLDAHRDYLELPPPDRYVPVSQAYPPVAAPPAPGSAGSDADGQPDEVRDDGRGGADEDLASA